MGRENRAGLVNESKYHTQNAVRLLERAKEINRQIKENPGSPENVERLNLMISMEREAFAESRRARALYGELVGQ